LASVSKILMLTFSHLVISGVSLYSCLCLEIVPLVILIFSISRPGRLALSSEFQWSQYSLHASSPLTGKVHRYLAFRPPPWPKQDLSQKLCCFGLSQKLLASVVHTLPCADNFWRSLKTKMSSAAAEAKPSRAERTPILWPGRWPDVWSPKRGLPQKLCGSCRSQKLFASVVHTLTCADYFWRSPGLYLLLEEASRR
jgi:hypothetical protein